VFKEQCDAGIYEVQLRPDAPPPTPDSDVRRYPLKICDRQVTVDKAKGTFTFTAVPLWTKHSTADLAAIVPPMDASAPHIEVTPLFSDLLPSEEDLKKWHVSEGDDVLALVYSPNITSERPSEALVRQGVISEFRERADTFLVSLLIFPGNSGAPLFLKRSAVHVDFDSGAQFGSVNPLYLMGVLIQYLPYSEFAVSPQTKRPRVVFEENSGLARVVSSGRIRELLNQIAATLPRRP